MKESAIERLNYIDTSKLTGIFLMIIGHSGLQNGLTQFIYAFHIPLFFVLSGFVMKKESTNGMKRFGQFIIRRSKRLMIPYLLFALIFCKFDSYLDWI